MQAVVVGFRAIATLTCVAMLPGCATPVPDEHIAHTPSGRPEAIFGNQKVDQISGKIASFCMDSGHVVVSSSANQVICKGEMTGGETFLARMRLGNRFAATPELFYSFNVVQIGNDVRVQALITVDSSSTFGQKLGYEVEDAFAFNDVEKSLINMGGHPPS